MGPQSRLGTKIVSIYVGKDKVEFTIHKKLLCDRVKFFDKTFRGGFKEAEDGVMHLPEEDPDAFGLFVEWNYQAHCSSFLSHRDPKPLYRLYMFAEKILEERLANATIDLLTGWELQLLATQEPAFDIIEEVYERTMDGSPLRKLCISGLAYLAYVIVNPSSRLPAITTDNAKLDRIWELVSGSKEMFKDFLACMTEYMECHERVPSSWDKCHFHCHTTAAKCVYQIDEDNKGN